MRSGDLPGEFSPTPLERLMASPRSLRSLRYHLAALLAYLALSLLYLRPTWQDVTTGIPPSPLDPVFNLYILKWGIHQIGLGLSGGETDFWNAPFFFPAPQVITYSDHLAGPSAMAAAFTAVVPNPIAAFNLLFLGSFVLCGWSTWWVLRRSGLGGAAAFLGGAMYAFSSFRWDQMSHLQVLLAQWIPLTLWTWDRLLAQPGWRRAIVFLSFYVLHVTGGSYLAYMIHFPLLAILLVRLPGLRRRGDPWSALRVLVPVVLAAGLVLLPLYLPYVRNASERGFERTRLEVRSLGASLVSYVTPSASNLYAGDWSKPWRRGENSLFPGLLASALLLGGGLAGWRRRRRPPEQPLSRWKRAVLAGLTAAFAAGWLLGELRTWALFAPEVLPKPEVGSEVDTVLIAAGLAALLLRRWWGGNWPLSWAGMSPWERGLLAAGALCFLLSFPQIFLPLRGIVPGLDGLRVPARFHAFLSFTLAFFAAGALNRLLARFGAQRRRAAVAAGAILLLELAPKPVQVGCRCRGRKSSLPSTPGWPSRMTSRRSSSYPSAIPRPKSSTCTAARGTGSPWSTATAATIRAGTLRCARAASPHRRRLP